MIMSVVRFFFVIAFLLSGNVLAEGGCPPGQYPIGGQGARGCAPIPGGGATDNSPRPLGRWHKTWGAFAISEDASQMGVALKMPSRKAALRDAEDRCAANGGVGCKGGFAFKNQCAAVVGGVSDEGMGVVTYAGAAAEDRARSLAMVNCDRRGAECEVIYSGCTEQMFERF